MNWINEIKGVEFSTPFPFVKINTPAYIELDKDGGSEV
jgi:hypothetical protein